MSITKADDSGLCETSGVRFRIIALILGTLAALFLTFVSDPDTLVLFQIPMGASVILLVKSLAYFALAAGVVHFGFKTMFDYIDRSVLIQKAIDQGQAGLIFIGLSIFALAFAWIYSTLISLK